MGGDSHNRDDWRGIEMRIRVDEERAEERH